MFSCLESSSEQEHVNGHFASLLNEIFSGLIGNSDIISRCDILNELQLWNICVAINEEYSYVRLENHVLEIFLEQNDPKMLINMPEEEMNPSSFKQNTKQETFTDVKIKFPENTTKITPARHPDMMSYQSSSTASFYGKKLTISKSTPFENKIQEYNLNYKTKHELTDKVCATLRANINRQEKKSCKELKNLEALAEETQYQLSETASISESFHHNVVILGCDSNTGIISSEKFVMFARQFLDSGMMLCAKMRINMNGLDNKIGRLRRLLESKMEMSGVVTNADYENLVIKKNLGIETINNQQRFHDFIVKFQVNSSHTRNRCRKDLIKAEDELKSLETKISATRKKIAKIAKDAGYVEAEKEVALQNLEILKELSAKKAAPKASHYIALKDELSKLDKQRKILERQTRLLNIRLTNAIQKSKTSK